MKIYKDPSAEKKYLILVVTVTVLGVEVNPNHMHQIICIFVSHISPCERTPPTTFFYTFRLADIFLSQLHFQPSSKTDECNVQATS